MNETNQSGSSAAALVTDGIPACACESQTIAELSSELERMRHESNLQRDKFWQSLKDLDESRTELKTAQSTLWRIAANTFSLLGEARLTEAGMQLSFFGDVPPHEKLGIAKDVDVSSVESLLAIMHPDDIKPFQSSMEHTITTGNPFCIVYRLSDGQGGWRWLKARACSQEKRDGRHVRFLHDTADITEQMYAEETLRKTVDELQQLKTQLQRENRYLREEGCWSAENMEIVGQGAALSRVLRQVELVAPTTATVLISGETGTGKELIARAIHRHSDRRNHLFVAINCAALPSTLVESELFGHEKGAFTGAHSRRAGRFEKADQGTLLLDEIGELPLETQAKLLRVLQSGEYERVGGDTTLQVNVRIIAATNRDLEQAVREGRFRSDLYHRLSVFPIHLPALRDRLEDIPLLTAYITARLSKKLGRRIDQINNSVLERLTAYEWPGNIRELENVIERAIILSPGSSLQLDDGMLSTKYTEKTRAPNTSDMLAESAASTLPELEKFHILRICEATNWKIKGPQGAAIRLGLNPGTLYARMKKLGIRRP